MTTVKRIRMILIVYALPILLAVLTLAVTAAPPYRWR